MKLPDYLDTGITVIVLFPIFFAMWTVSLLLPKWFWANASVPRSHTRRGFIRFLADL